MSERGVRVIIRPIGGTQRESKRTLSARLDLRIRDSVERVRRIAGLQKNQWPTAEWRQLHARAAGMDSAPLALMMERIKSEQIGLHSVVIVRHGCIVAEAYFQPYDAQRKVEIYSVTKSVVSALVGIAIKQGAIDGWATRSWTTFPISPSRTMTARKRAITLEQLLTMSSGLKWSDDANNGEMDQSQDAVKLRSRSTDGGRPRAGIRV